MLDVYLNYFFFIKKVLDDEEVLIVFLVLGGYDLDSLGDKLFDFEMVIEIFCCDGSVFVSLDELVILNLKNMYVNFVGILGLYKLKIFCGNVLFFRLIIIFEWFDLIELDLWKFYING